MHGDLHRPRPARALFDPRDRLWRGRKSVGCPMQDQRDAGARALTEWKVEAVESVRGRPGHLPARTSTCTPALTRSTSLLVNRGGMNLTDRPTRRGDRRRRGGCQARRQAVLRPCPAGPDLREAGPARSGRPKRSTYDRTAARPLSWTRPQRLLLVGPPHLRKDGTSARNLAPAQRATAIRDLEQVIRLEPRDSPQKADDNARLGPAAAPREEPRSPLTTRRCGSTLTTSRLCGSGPWHFWSKSDTTTCWRRATPFWRRESRRPISSRSAARPG